MSWIVVAKGTNLPVSMGSGFGGMKPASTTADEYLTPMGEWSTDKNKATRFPDSSRAWLAATESRRHGAMAEETE